MSRRPEMSSPVHLSEPGPKSIRERGRNQRRSFKRRTRPHHGRAGRGVRRYRHLAALCHARDRAGGRRPFAGPGGGHGAVSLIFWALVIVVTIKYVVFIMRADNNGEGGVLALAALAHRAAGQPRRQDRDRHRRLAGPGAVLWRRHADAGDLGAFGDGRPERGWQQSSRLGSSRSLWPSWSACSCLQRRGTEKIGKIFGPVMVALVHRHRRFGRGRHPQIAADSQGRQSALWKTTSCEQLKFAAGAKQSETRVDWPSNRRRLNGV